MIVDEKGIKDSWKEYMEKLTNEENEWVPREVIRWAMRQLVVEEWLVLAVMSMYRGAKTVVKTGTRKRYCIKYQVSYITSLLTHSVHPSGYIHCLPKKGRNQTL